MTFCRFFAVPALLIMLNEMNADLT